MTANRWRTTKNMSVSGCKPKLQPKPPPPQGGRRSEQNRSFQQVPKSMGINTTGLAVQQSQKQSLCDSPVQETPSNNVRAEAISVPSIVREDPAKVVLRLLSTDGCSTGAHEALPRSGSAPSSSALASANPVGTVCLSSRRPTNEEPSLLAARIKMGCSTSEPEENFAKTTRSCWDERRDRTATPGDAATLPPRCGSASTAGNKAARTTTVSEEQQEEPSPQKSGPNNISRRSGGGLKGRSSGSGTLVGSCLHSCE